MRIDLIPEISDIPLSIRPKTVQPFRSPDAPPQRLSAMPPPPPQRLPPQPPPAPQPQTAIGGAPASRSEAIYAELFQNIYDAAIVTDLHGRIRIANKRAHSAFGYDPNRFSHLSVSDLVAGADADLVRTLYENLRRETFTVLQASCTRADGTSFPAEIAVSPIRLSTPHLCFLVRDETRRRQEGEMLRTEHNALQNSSDAIVVVALDTRIEYANPATARIWHLREPGDIVGRPVGDLLVNPVDGQAVIDSLAGETYDTAGETMARRADGETFRVEIRASCNRDSDGNAIGAVLSLTDLTDRDRFIAAEHDVETLRHAVDRFVSFHRSAKMNIEELSATLEAIAASSAASSDPTLRARINSAIGNTVALRTLGDDAEDLGANLSHPSPESPSPGNF